MSFHLLVNQIRILYSVTYFTYVVHQHIDTRLQQQNNTFPWCTLIKPKLSDGKTSMFAIELLAFLLYHSGSFQWSICKIVNSWKLQIKYKITIRVLALFMSQPNWWFEWIKSLVLENWNVLTQIDQFKCFWWSRCKWWR